MRRRAATPRWRARSCPRERNRARCGAPRSPLRRPGAEKRPGAKVARFRQPGAGRHPIELRDGIAMPAQPGEHRAVGDPVAVRERAGAGDPREAARGTLQARLAAAALREAISSSSRESGASSPSSTLSAARDLANRELREQRDHVAPHLALLGVVLRDERAEPERGDVGAELFVEPDGARAGSRCARSRGRRSSGCDRAPREIFTCAKRLGSRGAVDEHAGGAKVAASRRWGRAGTRPRDTRQPRCRDGRPGRGRGPARGSARPSGGRCSSTSRRAARDPPHSGRPAPPSRAPAAHGPGPRSLSRASPIPDEQPGDRLPALPSRRPRVPRGGR